jgi:glycosyltransferase involved in cell wall biosynthesis
MARNEEWILEASIKQARKWCDVIVVFDHASTDRTPEIASALADRYIREDDPIWREMEYRHRMFEETAKLKPSHLALVDADELISENAIELYRDAVLQLAPREVARAPMIPAWGSLDMYRSDSSVWSTAWISIGVGFHAGLEWKPKGGYQHHAREPRKTELYADIGRRYRNGVFHLQFAYKRRLKAKHAWYKMMEVTRYPFKPVDMIDRQYNQALNESDMKLVECPKEWWDPEIKALIDTDHEPWHEAECKRLWAEHGPEKFAGLNLFGVVP